MDSLKNKNKNEICELACNKLTKALENTIVQILLSLCLLIAAAVYYYALHLSFSPNGEDLHPIWLVMHYGFCGGEKVFSALATISYHLGGGMSYKSARILITILYTLVCGFVLFLILYKNKKNWYTLPFFVLFIVGLFPLANNPVKFMHSVEQADLMYFYPFDYHTLSRLIAFLGFVVVSIALEQKNKIVQVILWCLTGATILYGIKMPEIDLVFYIVFIAPMAWIAFLQLISNKNARIRNYTLYGIAILFVFIVLSRFLPIESVRALWTVKPTWAYAKDSMYGATNWVAIDQIGKHIANYIDLILILFNIPLAETPIISLYTITNMLKLMVLLAGFSIQLTICKDSIASKRDWPIIDKLIAWSFFFLSCAFIFTEYGRGDSSRYFNCLSPLMVVILCRNIDKLFIFLKKKELERLLSSNIFRVGSAVFGFLLCVVTLGKVWEYQAPENYDEDLKSIISYIENDGRDGEVVGNYWIYRRVVALSNERVDAYEKLNSFYSVGNWDPKITYVITQADTPELDNPACAYEKIEEITVSPDEQIQFKNLKLMIYEHGTDGEH